MQSISKMTKKIIKIFKKDAETLAIETGFKQRDSKLYPEAFLTSFVISQLVNQESSLEDTCAILKEHFDINISKQGLCSRFNKHSVAFFKATFDNLLTSFSKKNLQSPTILDQFTKVELLDSSVINLPKSLKEFYPGFGGSSSEAAIRLQTIFDYSNNALSGVELTPATQNDQGYKNHLPLIQEGALLLQDLGYFDLNSFKQIDEKGAYFLSRFKSNTNVYIRSNTEYEQLNLVEYLENNKNKELISFHAHIGAKLKLPVRFVLRPVPDDVYHQRLMRVKKERKREKLTENTICLYKWDIYITNIPATMIVSEHLFTIYKLRWQIELLFKLIKSQAGIDNISGRKEPRIIGEIYAKLILIALLLYLTNADVLEEQPEISLPKAFNKLKSFGYSLLQAMQSEYKLKILLNKVLNIFSMSTIKERKRKKRRTTLQILEELA